VTFRQYAKDCPVGGANAQILEGGGAQGGFEVVVGFARFPEAAGRT
jgi:hypothetical protein